MSRLEGFPPISTASAHTLILGSMPGAASLAAARYYAHPRNLFWPIIDTVLGIDACAPYAERTLALSERGFALWDVLGACRRAGSLDMHIEPASVEVNDFQSFLAHHRLLTRIFFNGAAAEQLFRRRVVPALDPARRLSLIRLPSTSPANASVPYAAKLSAWRRLAG
jgi:double-stranded uracil-DNA glycosylase